MTNDDITPLEKLESVVPFISGKRITGAIAAYSLGTTAWDQIKPYIQAYSKRFSHALVISEESEAFEPISDWTFEQLSDGRATKASMNFSSVHKTGYSMKPTNVDSNTFKIKFAGKKVTVTIHEETSGTKKERPTKPAPTKFIFRTYDKEVYDKLIEKFLEVYLTNKTITRPPKLYQTTSWGFTSNGSIPPRPLKSVVLKKDELNYILDDVENFLDSEDRYIDLGLPWHRGYLFYGDAGTGKTSIAKAISAHFGLDVYTLSIGDINDDMGLNDFVRQLRPRSVLLLEDVDVFSAATSREAEDHNASLSGLLNVLDGMATPHGMITIMTTNHVEKLDHALIRPGRIDLQCEFTALDDDQGVRLFEHFYGVKPDTNFNFTGMVPADVIGIFKQNLDSPDKAMVGLRKLRKSNK